MELHSKALPTGVTFDIDGVPDDFVEVTGVHGGDTLSNLADRDLLCVVLASSENDLVRKLTAEPHKFRESTVRSCVSAGCLTASQILDRLKSTAAKCKKCGRNELEPITVTGCGMSVCQSCLRRAVETAIDIGSCKGILDAGEGGKVVCPVSGCNAKLCERDVSAACKFPLMRIQYLYVI